MRYVNDRGHPLHAVLESPGYSPRVSTGMNFGKCMECEMVGYGVYSFHEVNYRVGLRVWYGNQLQCRNQGEFLVFT